MPLMTIGLSVKKVWIERASAAEYPAGRVSPRSTWRGVPQNGLKVQITEIYMRTIAPSGCSSQFLLDWMKKKEAHQQISGAEMLDPF